MTLSISELPDKTEKLNNKQSMTFKEITRPTLKTRTRQIIRGHDHTTETQNHQNEPGMGMTREISLRVPFLPAPSPQSGIPSPPAPRSGPLQL